MNTLYALGGMLFGAVLSWFVSKVCEHILTVRRLSLPRHWFGSWIPIVDSSSQWVDDEVVISVVLGQIRLSCRNNSKGFQWAGAGRLVDRRFFTGRWWFTNQGAHFSGIFVLSIAPDGKYMYGYCLTGDNPGAKVMSPWVLGVTKENVEIAKERLKETQYKLPRNQPSFSSNTTA